jgi:hypothetical protein
LFVRLQYRLKNMSIFCPLKLILLTVYRMDEKCLVINSEVYKSIVYKSEVLLLPNTHIPLLFLCLFGSGLG